MATKKQDYTPSQARETAIRHASQNQRPSSNYNRPDSYAKTYSTVFAQTKANSGKK